MKPGKNPINAKFRIENYVTGEAGPPDEGDALQRLAQSHFVGQDGAVHVGHREAHDAAVEEEDALALVRPQVFAQQRVDHHVHQHRAGVALLPLTKTKKTKRRARNNFKNYSCHETIRLQYCFGKRKHLILWCGLALISENRHLHFRRRLGHNEGRGGVRIVPRLDRNGVALLDRVEVQFGFVGDQRRHEVFGDRPAGHGRTRLFFGRRRLVVLAETGAAEVGAFRQDVLNLQNGTACNSWPFIVDRFWNRFLKKVQFTITSLPPTASRLPTSRSCSSASLKPLFWPISFPSIFWTFAPWNKIIICVKVFQIPLEWLSECWLSWQHLLPSFCASLQIVCTKPLQNTWKFLMLICLD